MLNLALQYLWLKTLSITFWSIIFQWYQLIGLSHDRKEIQMIEHIKIYKHNIKLPVLNDIQYTLKVMNNSI